MTTRARNTAGGRRATAYGPPCIHCRTPRIVMPLCQLRGFARKYAALVDLLGTLEELREFYRENDYVSLCPGCFCVTGDLSH